MSTDQVISLLRAVTDLLGVLVWPALLGFLLIRFSAPIGSFLANMRELTAKAGGVEISAKREEAVAALGAAIAHSPDGHAGDSRPSDAAKIIDRAIPNDRMYRRLQGARVLWVDDRPENNRFERESLESLGLEFSISTSTTDALAQLAHRPFDLVISDMDRPPDPRAGYTLLIAMRGQGDATPFLIYAGSRAPEHQVDARKHGAAGITNSPAELIGLVTQVLGSAR